MFCHSEPFLRLPALPAAGRRRQGKQAKRALRSMLRSEESWLQLSALESNETIRAQDKREQPEASRVPEETANVSFRGACFRRRGILACSRPALGPAMDTQDRGGKKACVSAQSPMAPEFPAWARAGRSRFSTLATKSLIVTPKWPQSRRFRLE